MFSDVTERRVDFTHKALELGEGRESRVIPHVTPQACDGRLRHQRADVVGNQAFDRRAGLRGEHHADQTTHRRADPAHPIDGQMRQQRRHVGAIGGISVVFLDHQPVTATTTGDVGADNAKIARQGACQRVEVAPVARQTMHADNHLGIVLRAPIRVVDSMESVWPEGEITAFTHG